MSEPIPARRRILCYGKYINLLASRRMLLEAIGCEVEVTDRGTDLRRSLDTGEEYALIIVCHTISAEERFSIESQSLAQGSNTVVYALEGTMEPQAFTLWISELLDRVGLDVPHHLNNRVALSASSVATFPRALFPL